MKALRIVLCLILLLLGVTPVAAARTQPELISCQSRPPSLTGLTKINASGCFMVTPARGSTVLRLDLGVSSGAYDIYVRQGNATTLGDADKVNVGAVSGSLTYVFPATGPYTVAVERTSSSGSAQLSPVPYQVTVDCSGSTCSAAYPLTSIPAAEFDDQALYKIPVSKAGRVEVKATWVGETRLSALLYGPSVSKTGITQSVLARKDGASPLAVSYDVRSTNLISGGKWSVGLNNASKAGGTVRSGTLTITYAR